MSVLSIVNIFSAPSLLYILLRIEKMASIDIQYLYVSPSRNSPDIQWNLISTPILIPIWANCRCNSDAAISDLNWAEPWRKHKQNYK